MKTLIERGHVFVARPPLFKVSQKKQVRYVQKEEEMARELLERGLNTTKLTVVAAQDPTAESTEEPEKLTFEQERLEQLLKILDKLERELVILERRGLTIATLLARLQDGKLPAYRVLLGSQEHWFFTSDEVDAFKNEQRRQGRELVAADEASAGNGENGHKDAFSVQELHEIRAVNSGLEKLNALGLQGADLIPAARVAGREPAPRFFLEHGGREQILPHLRELVPDVRMFG